MNNVNLIGRISTKPEMKMTNNNKAVLIFNLAYNRGSKKDDLTPYFFRINLFGNYALSMEKYLNKGVLIAVNGMLRQGMYIDKDGIKRYTTDIVCEKLDILEFKSKNAKDNSNNKNEEPKNQREERNYEEDYIDDYNLPFNLEGGEAF